MSKAKRFVKLWLPPLFYAILIFWISSLEKPFGIKLEGGILDKLAHFLEYAIFGFLLTRAIRLSEARITPKAAVSMVFAIGAFYGLTDELHQGVIPGRFASVSDFIFDSIGSFAGAVIFTMKWRSVKRARCLHTE